MKMKIKLIIAVMFCLMMVGLCPISAKADDANLSVDTPPADNLPSDIPPADNPPSDIPPADNSPVDTPSADYTHNFSNELSADDTQRDPNYEKKFTFNTVVNKRALRLQVPSNALDLSIVRTPAGFIHGIQTAVAGAKEGNTDKAIIFSAYPLNFTKEVLQAIRDGGMNVEYYFFHEGQLYNMTIPYDVNVNAVLVDSNVEGPLFVKKQLDLLSLGRPPIRRTSQNTGNIAINNSDITTNQSSIAVDINSIFNR